METTSTAKIPHPHQQADSDDRDAQISFRQHRPNALSANQVEGLIAQIDPRRLNELVSASCFLGLPRNFDISSILSTSANRKLSKLHKPSAGRNKAQNKNLENESLGLNTEKGNGIRKRHKPTKMKPFKLYGVSVYEKAVRKDVEMLKLRIQQRRCASEIAKPRWR